ncbi:diacylglycerol kinase 6-like [Carica papaya]|uniref:diacylglycerol kinase 6-like n=1 Tax=Carica papaya TaxID=3649 RepID=UPI000B8CFCAB|nr:diacylglycerol kinase 6-like [Carica papaya]
MEFLSKFSLRSRRWSHGSSLRSETVMGDPNSKHILEDYYIPNYILVPGSAVDIHSYIPPCPVIVFINSKSGGQLGGELIVSYRTLLNENQVFDLGEKPLILCCTSFMSLCLSLSTMEII